MKKSIPCATHACCSSPNVMGACHPFTTSGEDNLSHKALSMVLSLHSSILLAQQGIYTVSFSSADVNFNGTVTQDILLEYRC